MIALDFPEEGMELKTLADAVSRRLGVPILYDESITNKKVIIRVPVDVPEGALMGVLQSALRMKGMALVDAEPAGWKQIVLAQSLAAVARPATGPVTRPSGGEEAGAVSQVFTLKSADPNRVAEAIRPFLTQPGGNVLAVPGTRELIVSDYAAVIRRVDEVIRRLDVETPVEVRGVPLKYADAGHVVSTAKDMLGAKQGASGDTLAGAGIFLSADERANQVLVTAPPARMKEVLDVIGKIDTQIETQTRVYRLTNVSADRVDRLMKDLLGAAAGRSYQSSVDRESRSLVVSATPAVQAQLEALVKELDVPVAAEQSPIRFYKLKNTKAADVLATLNGLQGNEGGYGFDETGAGAGVSGEGRSTGVAGEALAPSLVPAPGVSSPEASPGVVQSRMGTRSAIQGGVMTPGGDMSRQQGIGGPGTVSSRSMGAAAYGARGAYGSYGGDRVAPGLSGGFGFGGQRSALSPDAVVTADVNTNSIIVIAAPAVQQMYAELIQKLDERRPQVQIECTIVTLDTSNGFTFGVDLGKMGLLRGNPLIAFSSFGISSVDPKTGHLSAVAAPGGTFALFDPRVADVVLRTLATNSRAKLLSAPQLLVNDNSKGQLESVAQQPYAEILDTATTQSRTGLGGQAQAGTKIVVEPHISAGDYLQLDYSIELSSFTGQAAGDLPPPSQKNAVESTVTIPDGYTIVVGGLSVKNLTAAVNTLPIIGDIPVLGWLFGTRSETKSDTTLFVFIRPVILRDDRFEDLKYISEGRLKRAGLPGDLPESAPIPLR